MSQGHTFLLPEYLNTAYRPQTHNGPEFFGTFNSKGSKKNCCSGMFLWCRVIRLDESNIGEVNTNAFRNNFISVLIGRLVFHFTSDHLSILPFLKTGNKLTTSPCCICMRIPFNSGTSRLIFANMVWNFCHWRPRHPRTFQFPTIGNNNLVHVWNCRMEATVVPLNMRSWRYDGNRIEIENFMKKTLILRVLK